MRLLPRKMDGRRKCMCAVDELWGAAIWIDVDLVDDFRGGKAPPRRESKPWTRLQAGLLMTPVRQRPRPKGLQAAESVVARRGAHTTRRPLPSSRRSCSETHIYTAGCDN